MKLGPHDLRQRRILIAELGNNHEGDPQMALEMVAAAAEAGADAVKVQVINPERLVHCSQTDRLKQLARFRLPLSVFAEMATAARARGVLFLASVFDVYSLDAVLDMLAAIKIASGDLDFEPLLIRAAKTGKTILLSTGMSTLAEIGTAVRCITAHLPAVSIEERLALLHCVSLYPTPLPDANLLAIRTLQETFALTTGYSDHTIGIESAVAALALGARIIEKHFTLDKSRRTFRDHSLSADPGDLRRLAAATHAFDQMLGDGAKRPSQAEAEAAAEARRGIVAARDLPAGTVLGGDDLEYLRPRTGLPPSDAKRIVGKRLRTALRNQDAILEDHLEPPRGN